MCSAAAKPQPTMPTLTFAIVLPPAFGEEDSSRLLGSGGRAHAHGSESGIGPLSDFKADLSKGRADRRRRCRAMDLKLAIGRVGRVRPVMQVDHRKLID